VGDDHSLDCGGNYEALYCHAFPRAKSRTWKGSGVRGYEMGDWSGFCAAFFRSRLAAYHSSVALKN
jgi:hypothetical protein